MGKLLECNGISLNSPDVRVPVEWSQKTQMTEIPVQTPSRPGPSRKNERMDWREGSDCLINRVSRVVQVSGLGLATKHLGRGFPNAWGSTSAGGTWRSTVKTGGRGACTRGGVSRNTGSMRF
jgi:hypothetical protein